jgi:organic radical activating enzyme
MKTLIVYPTFLCPYSCAFCLTKDKNSLNEFLDIFKLRDFLEKNASKFDKIKISGGEPMSINYDYFNELVDTLKEFNTNIVVSSYPVELKNYRDDIEYEFSYDFLARPRALEVWENLLNFPKKFDVKVLVSPQILKTFHPNVILNKLSILPNINTVEFKEYYRNETTMWNLNSLVYDKFIKLVLSSQLNVPFINLNKEKMRFLNGKTSKANESFFEEEYCLLPDNKLYVQQFNENDISYFKEINENDIGLEKVNYPEEYNFYSKNLRQWSLNNDI